MRQKIFVLYSFKIKISFTNQLDWTYITGKDYAFFIYSYHNNRRENYQLCPQLKQMHNNYVRNTPFLKIYSTRHRAR